MTPRLTAMFRARVALLCAGAMLAASACTPGLRKDTASATFVIVCHAERSNDDPRDPALSEAGLARAQRLATSLQSSRLVAVYATGYRRTQQTAAPIAAAHRLPITTYDASQPVGDLAAMLRNTYLRGTVLVVGHSNTAPGIAAALCGCVVTSSGDDVYGRRLVVRIGADGHAGLVETVDP